MKIGIVGSGHIGGNLGRLWAARGHVVMFSSRNPDELEGLVSQAGEHARAGTPDEAMRFGDLVLEAIPFAATLELPADALAGKILISASNYYPNRDGEIDLGDLSQSEALAQRLPDTRLVKAFNMMFADEMRARADGETDRPLAIFLASDDEAAKASVSTLIVDARFVPVDAGRLAAGVLFESGGPLYAKRLSADEASEALDAHSVAATS